MCPTDAEVVIDTLKLTAEEAAQEIFLRLEKEGYIGADERSPAPPIARIHIACGLAPKDAR